MIIGLTGTYCAGKNTIARLLEKRGFPVLDVDKFGHQAIETEKNAIIARFGDDILNSDGTVNRKFLGEKVFGKPIELAALENIVHPAANRETIAWIKARQAGACVINAALLHRSSAFGDLDAVIVVRSPFFTRLLRARKRDRLSFSALFRRLRSQKEFTSQYFTGNADIYRVENPGYFFFGLFPSSKRKAEQKLENRIDEILYSLGLNKV